MMLDNFDADVAAGLREDTLNDFFDAHHKSEQGSPTSVYKGGGSISSVKLDFSYEIAKAAKVDLAPLSNEEFKKIYTSWLLTVPEIARFKDLPDDLPQDEKELGTVFDSPPPPNVAINVQDLHLKVSAKPENEPPIEVTFKLGIRVTAFLESVLTNGRSVLRLTPVAARIRDRGAFESHIDSVLEEKNLKESSIESINGDEPDCTSLRRLIIFLANEIIASRLSQFVKEFELPTPIDLFDGFSINTIELEIVDDLVVALGKVTKTLSSNAIDDETERLLNEESGEELVKMHDEISKMIQGISVDESKIVSATPQSVDELENYPDRGVFLVIHQRLLQLIADEFLVFKQSRQECRTFLGIFKGCYDWFIRVWNPRVSLSSNSVILTTDLKGGGGAKICIKTHCGDKCHRVGASLDGDPRAGALVVFKGAKEIWIDPKLISFPHKWNVSGLPWPFSKFVSWFLKLLSSVALLFGKKWVNRYQKRIVKLPEQFPGTTLKYDARFDRHLVRLPGTDALAAIGEIDFRS